jgi:hypothetical protein
MGTPQSNHLISKTKSQIIITIIGLSINFKLSRKDTDLFIDLHPPKTFHLQLRLLNIHFLCNSQLD